MKDLKCGLMDCRYNKGYSCCAKQISVDNLTDCATYAPGEEKNTSMFEAGEDFVPVNYSVDTKVFCDANCVFNKNNTCISNGITVMSDSANDAICLTFIKD